MSKPLQFEEIRSGVFVAPGNYAIRRDTNETPAYWIAYRPDSNGRLSLSPQYELGAGAGDEGWAKCVRLCEMEYRTTLPGYADSNVNHSAPNHRCNDPHCELKISSKVNPTPKASEPSSNNIEPQQQGSLL